jgi:hypothetical protein
MSASRKACNIQLVEIQPGERVAATPEQTLTLGKVTSLREAESQGYRAITQVKGLS